MPPPVRAPLFLLIAAVLGAEVRLDPPLVRQDKNGCGAASVAMVMRYWATQMDGVETPAPSAIEAAVRADADGGLPLAEMKRYLGEHGFRAFTVRGGMDDVVQHLERRRPLIAVLQPGKHKGLHYVVLSGFDDRRVWLHDPARGRPKRMNRQKFEQQWAAADRWMLLAAPDR